MSAEKMRGEFEAWANTHYLLSEINWSFEGGEYDEPEMQYAWEAWQASREALVIELPPRRNHDLSVHSHEEETTWNYCLDECRDAIDSAIAKEIKS